MLPRLLPASVEGLLREERAVLLRLRGILARLNASTAQQQTLDESIVQLDEPFLLVVVGEFNAGKSAFINALVGQPILKEGVTPTTALVTLLEYSDAPQQAVMDAKILTVRAPARSSATSASLIHRGPTPSFGSTRRSHRSSCHVPTWCSSSLPPNAPSPKRSGLSWSGFVPGERKSSSS